jgi:hypothetical protein
MVQCNVGILEERKNSRNSFSNICFLEMENNHEKEKSRFLKLYLSRNLVFAVHGKTIVFVDQ